VPACRRCQHRVRYVALGDSYASGPGMPEQRADPTGCQRSTTNYPALLAQALQVRTYIDVTCGGARADHITVSQPVAPGPNPPQFDALTPDTDLVTVSIGDNDIDIGGLWLACAPLGASYPRGGPCQRQTTGDDYAQRIAATAPKVARMLDGIHQRSACDGAAGRVPAGAATHCRVLSGAPDRSR
jgi:lysophospholipase L1-like esterase